MAFSFSVAALIEGKVDASWARWVRPWVLAAWCFLTIGITLGSFWAYYELGWGGWWFWDPVENASFMPWLTGTALLHSALVVERRQTLVNWTILLGILTFSLSLIGTFLVRSGRADQRAFLRARSGARHLRARPDRADLRRRAGALRLSRTRLEGRHALCRRQPRIEPRAQQCAAGFGGRDRVSRHLLSAGHRGDQQRQDLGRAALLQSHLRSDDDPAARSSWRSGRC